MRVLQFPSQYRQGESPYELFKDRMAAISSITTGIKDIISNKYINKQNSMIAENIQNEIDKQKAIDLSNLILGDPPDEIYPENLEDTIGQFIDKFAMGPMRQKETMMGNLPAPAPQAGVPSGVTPTGTLPGVTPTPTTEEAMIPKNNLYQLYNVIKEIPTGQITWDNVYKKMTEKKPFWMGTTPAEEFVLNQMMGQVGDPRAKIASDINLSKLVKEAFYPEAEKPTEWDKKLDLFLQTDPTVEEVKQFVGGRIAPEKMSDFDKRLATFMLTEPTVPEMKKFLGGYIAEPVDIKSILENIPEGFEINSFNMSTTGATSFSFKPIDTDNPWGFDTWDEAQEFLRTHPQEGYIGKIVTNGKGFDVKWDKETGTTIKPPTIYEAKAIEETLMNNVENATDFGYELDKLKSQGKDTSFYETKEYYPKLMKKKYDEAMDAVKYCTQGIKSGKEFDEDGLNYKETYQKWYEKLKNYDQEYFNVTGNHLLEEESEITKTGEDLKKKEITNKTRELAKEMLKNNISLQDLDIDRVKALGIDIEELQKILIQLINR